MALNNLGLGFVLSAKDQASGIFAKAGKALGDLKKDATEATAAIMRSGAGIKDALGGAIGSIDRAKIAEVGGELKNIGQKMTAVGLAGVAGLGAATMSAAEFNRKIAEVATEADPAKFSMAEMSKIATDLAQQFGMMPVAEAEGLYDALGFGADTAAKATSIMTASNYLAVAGVTDVKTAMSALAGTAKSYGLEMTATADISDAFFKAMTLGKTTVGQLAEAMPGVTGLAANMGVSYETLLGTISTLTGKNIKAAEAATGLKAVLSGIAKPTGDAEKEAKRLGISFDTAALKSKGLQQFLKDIVTNPKYDANKTFSALFGSVEAMNAVMALTSNNMSDYNDVLAAIKDRSGAAAGGFAIIANEAGFQFDQLKATFMVTLVEIGKVILPIAGAIAGAIRSVLTAFNNLPDPVKKAIVLSVAFASSALAIAGVVVTVVGGIMALATSLETVAAAFVGVIAIVGALVPPIAAVAGAFALLQAGIEVNAGGIGDFFKEMHKKASLAVDALSQLFSSGKLTGAVNAELSKVENGSLFEFVRAIFTLGSQIKAFFTGMAGVISDGFYTMGDEFEEVKQVFVEFLQLLNFIPSSVSATQAAFDTAEASGESFGKTIVEGIRALVGMLRGGLRFVLGFVEGFKFAAGAGGVFGNALKALGQSLDIVMTAFASVLGGTNSATSGMQGFGRIVGYVIGSVVPVISYAAIIFSTVFNVIVGVISAVGSALNGFATVMSGVFNVVAGILSGDGSRAWFGFKQVVYGNMLGILGIVTSVVGAIAAVIDGLGKIIGKDFGLQKSIETTKGNMLSGLAKEFGVDKSPQGAPPPQPGTKGVAQPFGQGAQPFTGAPGQAATTNSPGVAAAAGAAEQGQKNLALTSVAANAPPPPPPPPPVEVTVNSQLSLDAAIIAEQVEKVVAANGNRAMK